MFRLLFSLSLAVSGPAVRHEKECMKILYVDDSPFTRKLMKKSLEQGKHETREATNGQEALDLLRQELPDLLLTDLLMHGISGKELLRTVHGLYPHLPIIVVSADAQESTLTECLALGAKALFPKGGLYTNAKEFMDLLERIGASNNT